MLRITWILCLLGLLSACVTEKSASERQCNPKKAGQLNAQLGTAYLRQGDLVRAKQKLIKALEYAPSDSDVNTAWAVYLEETKKYEDAGSYYRKAISYGKHKGRPKNNYGAFLCRRGNYNQAMKYLLNAANDKTYDQAASAFENAAICSMKQGYYKSAKKYFLRALDNDPGREKSIKGLAAMKKRLNRSRLVKKSNARYAKKTSKRKVS